MVYINRNGLVIDDELDIIEDKFYIGLNLSRNTTYNSSPIGIFNLNPSDFNSSKLDEIQADITSYLQNNNINNINIEGIEIKDKKLYLRLKINKEDIEEDRELLLDGIF